MKRLVVFGALAALALMSCFAPLRQGAALAAGGSTLNRPEDPVVLTGADVPTLAGIAPGDLVAFRYGSGWVQIPVQVDERDTKTFAAIYNVGANSGPLTQRDQIFYAQRQKIRTYLRVHAIPSVMDFFDYSPAASGMTYYNDLNTGGITIDGVPETPVAGAFQWQMVTGAQGTVVQAGALSSNIAGFTYTSYYYDQAPAGVGQCTGDNASHGSSGTYVTGIPGGIPCTDPGLGCTNYLNTTNTLYYEAPGVSVATAQALNAAANAPLTHTIQPWQNLTPGVGGIAEAATPLALSGSSGGRAGIVLVLTTLAALGGVGLLAARRVTKRLSARAARRVALSRIGR